MNTPRSSEEIDAANQQALEELAWAIELAVGEFTLFLVRCNYATERSQMIARLQAVCRVPLRLVMLEASTQTLYTTLQAELAGEQPQAVMVLGLEQVRGLDQMLVTIDQVREEFRKNCPFPLVLWVDDPTFKVLQRVAPNFASWVSDTTELMVSTETLLDSLRQGSGDLFARVFTPDSPLSLNRLIAELDLGSLRRRELELALQDLQHRGERLTTDLQASLDLIQGCDAIEPDEALQYFERSLAVWQQEGNVLKAALALFFIGFTRYWAIDREKHKDADWEPAKVPLEQSMTLFEQAGRLDLAGKCITRLERVLQRLQDWQALETLVQKGIVLHQRYANFSKLSQDYGFLSEVAQHRGQWTEAKRWAEQALETLAQLPGDHWSEGLYLLLLAQAERGAGQVEAAIAHLQQAMNLGDRGHPQIYVRVLEELRQLHWDQKQYLEAFKLKQTRLAVEQQYGIRAFVGPGRLRAKRTDQGILKPRTDEDPESVALEIAASGRQKDLERIVERIGRNDYKLIVIHGHSGVGKSSLVNAGLLPRLKQRAIGTKDNLLVLVRTYTDWVAELAQRFTEAMEERRVKGRDTRPCASTNTDLIPTLLNQLRQNEQHNLRTVLIFDQFEEFFFANPNPLQRRQFFEFLVGCLHILSVKVILSLREDYIHYLLECNRLPGMGVINQDILGKNVLYSLGNFSPEDTRSIIDVLTERSRFYLEAELIEALVHDLAGELREVRPIELQIVGAQLQTEGIKTLAQYRELGERPKEELVQRYLAEVVRDCGEENRQIAELILYLLTDERGTRPLKTRSELERELEALVPGGEKNEGNQFDLILKILCGSGLVVYLPESPEDRYQLVHDYIAEFVRQQQASRLEQIVAELKEERRQRQEAEAEREVLAVANRKAKRRLIISAGLLAASLVAALVAIPTALMAFHMAQQEKAIAQQSRNDLEQTTALLQTREQAVRIAEARKQEAEQNLQQREQELKQTGQELRQAQQDLEEGRTALEQIEQESGRKIQDAQALVRQLESRVNWARQEQEEARRRTAEAQAKLREAEDAVATAQVQLGQVETLRAEAIKGTELERAGVRALQQFRPEEQIEALLSAMHAGYELKSIVQDGRPLEEYPAFSPIAALQQILNSIREKNKIPLSVGKIKSSSFSANGQYLVTASDEDIIQLWDSHGNQIWEFKNSSVTQSIDFSLDGQHIVVLSRRGFPGESTVEVWSLQKEQILRVTGTSSDERSTTKGNASFSSAEYHHGIFTEVSLSPDGKKIATGSMSGTIQLWDFTGEKIAEFIAYQDSEDASFTAISFSPDGEKIAIGLRTAEYGYGTVQMWDIKGNKITEFTAHQGIIRDLRFSPDGQYLATASFDQTARLWGLNGNQVAEFKGHTGTVYRVIFGENGQQIATVSEDTTARIWNTKGEELLNLKVLVDTQLLTFGAQRQGTSITSMRFSSDENNLITLSSGGEIRWWNLQNKRPPQFIENVTTESISFDSSGQNFVSSSSEGIAYLWDLQGNLLAEFRPSASRTVFTGVGFSPNGQYIAASSTSQSAFIWDLQGKQIARLPHPYSVTSISFSPNSQLIATATQDGKAFLWDLQGNQLALFQEHQDEIWSIEFSPDGRYVATPSFDGTVRVWDLQGKQVAEFRQSEYQFTSLSFHPHHQQIAVSSTDGTVHLWNQQTNEFSRFRAHEGAIWRIAFSPDGQRLATASVDATARMWDLRGNQLAEFDEDGVRTYSVSFSPNGKFLAVGTNEGLRLWPVENLDELLAKGCNWLQDYLRYSPEAKDADQQLCDIP